MAPVPAINGTLPFTLWTKYVINFICSLKSIVADSPVVPTATIPEIPLSIWKLIKLSKAEKSIDPSLFIGLAIAVIAPVIFINKILFKIFFIRVILSQIKDIKRIMDYDSKNK